MRSSCEGEATGDGDKRYAWASCKCIEFLASTLVDLMTKPITIEADRILGSP